VPASLCPGGANKVDADSLLRTTLPAQPAIAVACFALEVLGDLWMRKDQKALEL
jgi:hypothetical protein